MPLLVIEDRCCHLNKWVTLRVVHCRRMSRLWRSGSG